MPHTHIYTQVPYLCFPRDKTRRSVAEYVLNDSEEHETAQVSTDHNNKTHTQNNPTHTQHDKTHTQHKKKHSQHKHHLMIRREFLALRCQDSRLALSPLRTAAQDVLIRKTC